MGQNIFLTGFMGTGKTSVGREVARRLGRRFVDVDDEIVAAQGRSIEAIFESDGEDEFRRIERERLAEVCRADGQVVSTGGGVPEDDGNRRIMEENGLIVLLEARTDTLRRRLRLDAQGGGPPAVRPMLKGSDPMKRIGDLKARRQFSYSQAHWTVHTDRLSINDVAAEVVRAYQASDAVNTNGDPQDDPALATTVTTAAGDYPAWVGWGLLADLGERVTGKMSPGAAYVITDEGAQRHARRAQFSLEAAGVPAHLFIVSAGERSKSLETAQHIYGWLAERRAERGHLVVAVGGGMVGDLAGFVAATYLRGLLFAQVPTTVLAMMDASIGGKTAVDLPQGKNLVGAFYQPAFVLADVELLRSLPERERVSGWAEAIKHGLILDEGLLKKLEAGASAILSLDTEVTTEAVRRSVAIKAEVVSRDEKETLGLRLLLNYGHTIGHAIEAATGYERFLHGEAVSIGMMGAAAIARSIGLLSEDEVERQRSVLRAFDLPLTSPGFDVAAVQEAMSMDKKRSDGVQRWVLLDGIGHAVSRTDVPGEVVAEALAGLSG